MAAALLAGPVAAEEWQPLAGEDLRAALAARTVVHADGTRQGWFADGTTLCDGTLPRRGRWGVHGDLCCSEWPGLRATRCARIARSARGLDLRLTLPDGTAGTARYVDLRGRIRRAWQRPAPLPRGAEAAVARRPRPG